MPEGSVGHIAPIIAIHAITTVTASEHSHRYKYHYDNGDDFQQSTFHTRILDPFHARRGDRTTATAPRTTQAHIVSI